MRSALCWLRRDLRLADNTALERATHAYDQVAVTFVFDTRILEPLPRTDTRVTFIHQSVSELAGALDTLGSSLDVLHGDPVRLVPELARKLQVETVLASHDDDPYALSRDQEVGRALQQAGIGLTTVRDHVVFERQEIMNSNGEPFKVFTPYRNAWLAKLKDADIAHRQPRLDRLWPRRQQETPTLADLGFEGAQPWIAGGESAAKGRLAAFLERVHHYPERRDFPNQPSTSTLSSDLRHGTVSIRECVREALRAKATKWLDELVWREFYHMVLANFPHVVSEPFRPEFKRVQWPGDPSHFEPWKRGQTGYPFVDAAMRCLDATGWMHNRLRMVVAMFLTKDLLLDYRLGEAWFAEKLLDFELASNNGGWQWSSSTGVDAQPWFRVFNPVLQSRKFDPDGSFIRQWCPELSQLDDSAVHWPHDLSWMEQVAAQCEIGKDYPHPIVDHQAQRNLALAFLKQVSAQSG